MPTDSEPASNVPRRDGAGHRDSALDQLTLFDLIRNLARAEPDRPALRERDETLTFGALWERSLNLAAWLHHRGMKRGDVVAIALPRSIDLLVACVAVMRAGGVVLGLDLRSPDARNSRIVSRARVAWGITRGDDVHACLVGIPSVDIGEATAPGEGPEFVLDPEAPAFLVFTSGSTGEPKGVILSHRALVARAGMERAAYVSGQADVVLFAASPAFIALPVVIAYLSVGAMLLIVDDETYRDPRALATTLQNGRATHAGFPPRLLERLLELPDAGEKLSSLRVLSSFGETLPSSLAARLRSAAPHCRLVDRYGTTETSWVVTMTDLGAGARELPSGPVGAPLPGVEIRLVNEEIWVASPALASGYLGGEEVTDPKFVTTIAPGEAAPRLWYRTGDRGRLSSDGGLTVLGRLDLQLNIDGVRADPREIENALRTHDSVADAAVCTHPDALGRARLVAYVVDRGRPATSANLRAFLSQIVPAPLIPARFVRLDALPLTPSGKVDRASLPRPAAIVTSSAPVTTETESVVLGHFRAVLGLPDLGLDDDFFDWGGDSLRATDLMARVASSTGVTLAPVVILDHPTVRGLARRVSRGSGGPVTTTWLARSGDSPPLFCLPGITGDPLAFLPLALALQPRRQVVGVSLVELVPPISISSVVSEALAGVRAVQPTGPYCFLGYSAGGLIAFEMAAELRAQGEDVPFVGLMDTFVPGRARDPKRLGRSSLLDRARQLRHRIPNSTMEWLRGRLPRLGVVQRLVGPTAVRGLRQAFAAHSLEPRDVAVTLFRAQKELARWPSHCWGPFAKRGVTMRVVPGDHVSLMERRHLQDLSRQVSEALLESLDGANRLV